MYMHNFSDLYLYFEKLYIIFLLFTNLTLLVVCHIIPPEINFSF